MTGGPLVALFVSERQIGTAILRESRMTGVFYVHVAVRNGLITLNNHTWKSVKSNYENERKLTSFPRAKSLDNRHWGPVSAVLHGPGETGRLCQAIL